MKKSPNRYYWSSQFVGWTLNSFLINGWNYLRGGGDLIDSVPLFLAVIILGIALSHTLRYLINKSGWLNMRLGVIVPRLIFGSIVFGVLYALMLSAFLDIYMPPPSASETPDLASNIGQFFSWTVIFLLWSTGYLAYHYLRNYEREEIKNLRLQSSQNEVELASLKAQLNPHFIFNAMNSIRALVDEDPKLAKTAVTKLSNILRNSLMKERGNLVTLKEEIELVMDHLSLEQIRYEERLRQEFNIDGSLLELRIPPMMIQTLVENAIKHGISKLQRGGVLRISIQKINEELEVTVENSGTLSHAAPITGIGLSNLRRRLKILYEDKANLSIKQSESKTVRATITLPIN